MAHADLTTYAGEVLGAHRLARVHRETPTTLVHEVIDDRGTHWFVKSVLRPRKWNQELQAYRSWVPGLGDRAPQFVHADDTRRAFVTSAVPGRPAAAFSAPVHRSAGALLATVHGLGGLAAIRGDAWRAWSRMTGRRTERALETCHRLRVPVPEDAVRRWLHEIAELGPLPMAPCHGDYLPTNWLVLDDEVRLIDFGEAGPRPRGVAFARRQVGAWWERPDLADAFHEGYGAPLSDAEQRFVELHRGLGALLLLRWGATRGNADVVRRAQQRLAALSEAPERTPFA